MSMIGALPGPTPDYLVNTNFGIIVGGLNNLDSAIKVAEEVLRKYCSDQDFCTINELTKGVDNLRSFYKCVLTVKIHRPFDTICRFTYKRDRDWVDSLMDSE